MPDDSDQRVRTLAVALTAAERVATQRQRVDAARPFLLTALGAGAVAVVALLLPWVSGTPTYRNGVELGWWLPAITVLAGIGFASISLTTPPWIGTHGLRSVVVTIGIVVAISAAAAAVAATNDTGEDVLWPGPITFLLATVVTTAASVAGFANRGASAVDLLQYERGLGEAEVRARIAAAPPDDGVRHRPWPLIVGTGGLLLAAAGLLGPWERITGPAARALTDGGSLVRLGPELATTYALRWVVVGVLVAALLVAAVPQIRRALPVVLVASGVVIIVFAARAAASTSARGLTAELEPGTGVWLFLAGGVLAVLGGAAVAVRRNRTPVVSAVLIALTVAPAWTPPPARADAGSATLLFGASDYDARVGGSVRTAGVDTSEEDGVNAVADPAGGVWFLTSTRLRGRRVTVVQQQVGDRALPVTVLLTGFYDTKLLAVSGHYAIVQSDEDVINRIDLTEGEVDPVRFGRSPADDPGAAVLRAEQGSEPGTVDGKYLDARAGADGLVQVRVTGGDNGSRTYVIPAGTVRAAGPWVLPPPVVRENTTTTVRQDVTLSAATLDLLRRTVAGRTAPVLADTTDSRCTLSRDPLSLPPRGIVTSISAATQDAAGNLFVPIFVTPNRRALFVVTAAGELRRMPIAGDPQTVQGTPDGGLLVLTTVGRGRRVYRFADSAAAARDAQRLPARPDDCVSDNRASAPTATRTVVTGVAVSGVADDTALLGRDGSTLRSATSGIELSAPGRPTRTVDAVGSGRAYGVTADGRGGGWWFRSTGTRPPVLRHVDAAGKVRTLASGLPALTGLAEDANPATEFDAADGSLYWRDATAAVSRWQRTTLAGTTVATGFFGDRAWFGGGVAYLQLTSRSEVGRQRGTGAPVPMLATAPNLTSLIASVVRRTGPATVAASGLSADRKGRLLVWQGRWLGRVDGSRITLLAGPSDGLAHVDEARAITVSGDELIFVADGRVKRVSIR